MILQLSKIIKRDIRVRIIYRAFSCKLICAREPFHGSRAQRCREQNLQMDLQEIVCTRQKMCV